MRKFFMLSAIFAVSAISSCSHDKAEDPNPCAYDESQLKYNGFIKTIINTNCASDGACHGTPQGTDAGGEYLTYDQVKDKIDAGSFKSRVFDLKDMPQGSALSECDLKKLKDWVDAGAPE
jgi:hypothetical protein